MTCTELYATSQNSLSHWKARMFLVSFQAHTFKEGWMWRVCGWLKVGPVLQLLIAKYPHAISVQNKIPTVVDRVATLTRKRLTLFAPPHSRAGSPHSRSSSSHSRSTSFQFHLRSPLHTRIRISPLAFASPYSRSPLPTPVRLGRIFFWTKFHNLVVSTVKIAHAQMVLLRRRLQERVRSLDKATVDASPCLEGVCNSVGILWGRPTGLSVCSVLVLLVGFFEWLIDWLLNNDISEVTPLPLRNTGVAQMTVTVFAGESLLSLYRSSYVVHLLSCFYGIAIPRYNVCISMW